MSNEPSSPLNFTVSATKSDGRTWLHLKRSDGVSASLSCQASHDRGETIASQVVTEFADAVSEAADALEGGVTKLHGPFGHLNGHRALSEDSWTIEDDPLANDEEYFSIPLYALTDPFAEIGKDGPLSAPAQRVEEGQPITAPVSPSKIDPAWIQLIKMFKQHGQPEPPIELRDQLVIIMQWAWYGQRLAASPAPAPHAGVDDASPEAALSQKILDELTRARDKFPGKNVTFAALVEEVGELATATFEESADRVEKEAVQVAVMAMRMVLDGDHCFEDWRADKGLDPLDPSLRATLEDRT